MLHFTRLSRAWLLLIAMVFSGSLITASPNLLTPADDAEHPLVPMVLDASTLASEDLVPPVAICNSFTAPADVNCQAQVFAQAFNGGSYDPDGSIVSQSISPAGPFAVGTHTVTYTVVDNSGLSSSCQATLIVADVNGPSIVTANPTIALDANGQATITASDVVSSAIDNCDGAISNLTLSQSTFDCSDLVNNIGNATAGTLSGTLTADNLFEIYVSTDDNVQGTLYGSGSNWAQTYNMATAQLNPAQKYYIHVKATDVGGPEFFAGKFQLTGGFEFANGTQSLNTNNADWKVSSTGWGNYGTPFVVGQAGQQLQIWGTGVNTLSPAYLIWSGDWNTVGGETRYFTAEIRPIIPGTNVTVTGTDAAGNVTNATASVSLVDNMYPVAVINNNVTVTLDINGSATLSMSDIDAGSYDNCGIVSATLSRNSFDCNDGGTTVPVTLTLTDAAGNVTTATSQVTVNPTPSVVANSDSFSVQAGQPFTFNASDLTANDTDPFGQNLQVDAVLNPSIGTIVDNYDGTFTFNPGAASNQAVTASYIVKRDDGTIVFTGNGHVYEFVSASAITWSDAKAAAEGRTYNGMQGYLATITSASEDAFVALKLQGEGWLGASDAEVERTWKWVTGPENGTVFWDQNTQTAVNGQYANWSTGEPNDFKYGIPGHPGEDWAHYYSNGVWNDFPNSAGSIAGYIVEYGGMPNDCNVPSSATGTITFNVSDATPPTVLTQNIVVSLDANGQVSIVPSQVDNGSNDASGIASMSLDVTSFDCSNLGNNTVNLTVFDNNGNQASGSAVVTVEDNTNPTAVAVPTFTVTLDVTSTASISVSDIEAGSTDNCGIANSSLSKTSFDCNDVGSPVTITLTVADASGNTSSATTQVTVNPTPSIVANADAFNVNGGQPFTFSINDLIANDSDPLGQNLQVDAVVNPSVGTIVDNYNGTFTYNPGPASGQAVTASYIVRRADGTIVFGGNDHVYEFVSAPGISWTNAKIAAENRSYNGMQGYLATVTSASEDAFVAQKLQGEGWIGASDAAVEGVWKWVTGPEAGTQFWQSTYYTFLGIPTNSVRGGYAVNNQYNNWAGGEPNNAGGVEDWAHYWNNGLWNDYPLTASGISGYIVEYGGMPNDCNTPPANGQITFNVSDVTPPTVLTQNIVVSLDANGQVSIVPSQVDNGSNDASGIASLSLDVTSFDCNNLGANTVTLTVTDNNGNDATGTATVTVEDNTNPTAVAVPTFTVTLDLTATATISLSDIEAGSTDNCGIVSSSLSRTSFDCNDVGSPVAVTLTVVDASGNGSTATTMVTVNDIPAITANNDQFTAYTGQSFTFTAAQLTANDVDPMGQPLQVDAVGSASAGTLVDNNNGTFTYTPAGSANQTVSATYVVKRNDGTTANSANGHFYEFVTSPGISWSAAKVAAENMTYNGMQGYLATVTSAQENSFVAQKLQGEGWIGASDAESEGIWKWVTGPEAGTHFWSSTYNYSFWYGWYISGGYAVNGEYTNWAGGEPNDAGGAEDWAHYWTNGLWNDYPHQTNNISGYIVEYGGMPGDCNTSSTSTGTITFNVQDATPPSVLTQNVIVSLDANGQASVSASQVDNGSTDPSGIASMSLSQTSFDCSNLGQNTVTLVVTDTYGNSGTANATVTVQDNMDPVATVANGTFNLDANRSVTVMRPYLLSLVNATDNCNIGTIYFRNAQDGGLMAGRTYGCSDVGTVINVNVEIPDQSGNTIVIPTQFTVTDANYVCNTPPVAVCTPGSVPANNNCEALVLAQAFNGGSYDPDGDPITLSISPAGPFGLGTHTIVLTVTDDEGASSSCTTTLTVSDQTGPVVNTQNITVALDANGQATITPNDVVSSATDNCSAVTLSIDQNQFDCNSVPAVNGTGGPGVLSSTLTVDNLFNFYISTDDNVQGTYVGSGSNWAIPYSFTSNLPAGQTYYIHVEATDVGGPEMFLGKFQLSGGFQFANGTQTLVTNGADWKVSATGWNNYTAPLYLGNIGFGPWGYGLYSMTPAQFIWHGSYGTYGGETKYFSAPIYPTSTGSNVTVTATDAAGNTTTATATVDVIDNLPPVVSVQGITVNLDANGQATITASDIDNGSSDNCGIASYSLDVNSFDCSQAGTAVPVTMTVTDASGNSSSAVASVSVIDNSAPTAVANSGLVVQLDANGNGTLTAADVDGGSSDNCGIVSTTIDVTSFDCSNVGANTVVLTVVDAAGNSSSANTSVQVVDNVAPTVVANSNVVVQLDANGAGSLTAADVDGGSTDNCGVASVSIDVTSFNCSNVGSVPLTLTVTDVNGNVNSTVVNVTVEDNVAPTAICQNFSVDLPENANAYITAADIDNGSNDACGIASVTVSPSSFDCSNVGNNVVTLTVTDVNGNVSTCTAIVTVNKAPIVVADVISNFNGYNISCNGGTNGSIDLTVSGACQPYSYSWSNGATTEDVSGLSAGTYSVTITDGGGDTYNYSYTLTEPTALIAGSSMMPYTMFSGQTDSTIFLGCGPQSTTLSVSASGGVPGYTYSWAPATGLSGTTTASVTASPQTTTTYTATITDANGCVTTKSITVYVQDIRDPNHGHKVLICHLSKKKGQQRWHTISVSCNAVPAHLAHGDYLGACTDDAKVDQAVSLTADDVHALLYPNPSAGVSTLEVEVHHEEDVRIALFDYSGALIDIIHEGTLTPEYAHHFDVNASELPVGMYTVVIYTADGTQSLRWVIAR
ncbi:MAG: cadherin-like domain-containing protein [Flavobacteriia bacterium]|nr:cadherin-like domain-containing protein [Flavobacteriia bacterium]